MGFKERLKEAREQKGYTQTQLGEMVGVTKSAIANYETGVSSAKEQVLIKLMGALGVDANFLPILPPSLFRLCKDFRHILASAAF